MNISDLSAKQCTACTSKTPTLNQEQIDHYLTALKNWQLIKGKLEREIKVDNFQQALTLANRIGEIAEKQNHHPDLLVSWGLLRVSIATHAVNSLTENDFILAAKISNLIPN